jgi:hypothetical protein
VLGLTRFSARELGPHGITVNCLVPSLAIGAAGAVSSADRAAAVAAPRGADVGGALPLQRRVQLHHGRDPGL